MKIRNILILLSAMMAIHCGGDSEGTGGGGAEGMDVTLTLKSTEPTTATIEYAGEGAFVRVICEATVNPQAYKADEVFRRGTRYTKSPFTVEGLSPQTTYTLFAVGCDREGNYGKMSTLRFETADMYSWEKERTKIPSYTDLVLCYGGSNHRLGDWSKERFESVVSFTDPDTKQEQWLFDSFLFIEFTMNGYSLNLGQHQTSGDRSHWQQLLDYWFKKNYGFDALESAVKATTLRIGSPKTKRKVVMVLPDPIPYKEYADTKSSTTYWGEVNGRALDFSKAADRMEAYRWYINEVRRRFNEGNYHNIELAGFYIVSEDLATPGDGWNPELKHWEDLIPLLTAECHKLKYSVAWIPYYNAYGWKKEKWKNLFNIDYVYRQPGNFWRGPEESSADAQTPRPWSTFFSVNNVNDLNMEFEFDDALLGSGALAMAYKQRLRDYMYECKKAGAYGTRRFAYYHGNNTIYNLKKSTDASDQAMYAEFCRFVIGNPLRDSE